MAGTMHPCASSEHVRYTTPWGITVTVNKAVERRFREACNKAFNKSKWRRRTGRRPWKPGSIDSYNCRSIRGSSTYSRHAYAAAWDFFDKTYEERVKYGVDVWGPTDAPPAWFRNVFKKFGFRCGADYTGRKDYPHIEWVSNYVPPL